MREKQPQFIKEFSKEKSSEERQQLAHEVRAMRAKHFTDKRVQTERINALRQTTNERERVLSDKLKEIEGLENEIAELSVSRLGSIMNYLKLRKLRTDIAIGERTYEELKQLQDIAVSEQQTFSGKQETEKTPLALKTAEMMLNNFYAEQKEKWANSEYTKEDITKYFSEENLASLSLDDYALLLRRFPSETVSHVTRQGVRDHVGHMYHTGGIGAYANGFMRIAEDGRLRSALGIYLVESEKERAIAEFLHLDRLNSKEEALDYLTATTGTPEGGTGDYTDRMAIHFATEEVADGYYGSERANEIFIVYPSAFIASQYYFRGQLINSGGGNWNDQWVWANEERGIDLNAGIVFIPEKAKVDRKTGSRYELDDSRRPVKNTEYINAFKKVVGLPDFHNFADRVVEISDTQCLDIDKPELSQTDRELLQKLEPFRQRLELEFGIADRKLQYCILDGYNLSRIEIKKNELDKGQKPYESLDLLIERLLREKGILFFEARDTVSSKEFWELYFAKNQTKRPSKVVYYQGADPTMALLRWRKEQGIDKKAKDRDVGFSERHVGQNSSQANAGLERFKTLAEKIIEDHFAHAKGA